jgi:hypothetical protein
MNVLAELAAAEAELEGVVTSIEGTIEEKDSLLREQGVYRRYAEIFSRYLAQFEANPGEFEPPKRAAFLAWYELTEPPCFSGVSDLPADARLSVVKLLERHVSNLDSEFCWMLAYYFDIAPFAFPDFESHPGIRGVLESTDPEAWLTDPSAKDRMSGRGLMGEYWLSVFGSGAV